MKVAFGTVVYKEAWKFKDEYIKSLNDQSAHEFDVLIINDDVDCNQIQILEGEIIHPVKVFKKPYNMSIAELRIYLLATAKKLEYDLLILGDFDDVFEKKRVKAIVDVYSEEYEFYYNTLLTLEGNTVFKSLPNYLCDCNELLEQNFLGLSNTALNLKRISIDFIESLFQGKTNIFDWYLFTRLLAEGYNGRLVKGTATYYRIHENNIAGIIDMSLENVKKEITVKKIHYALLKDISTTLGEKYLQYQNITEDNYKDYLNLHDEGYWWNKIHIGNRRI